MEIAEGEILWIGRPSFLTKTGTYLLCLVIFIGGIWVLFHLPEIFNLYPDPYYKVAEYVFIAIPLLAFLIAGWTTINIYYTRWVLTEDTLFSRTNFLKGSYDTMWIHVIRDVGATRPLLWRFLDLGWVTLVTMDRTHPNYRIGLIPEPGKLELKINEMARESALEHGTRVIDWGGQ